MFNSANRLTSNFIDIEKSRAVGIDLCKVGKNSRNRPHYIF